MNPTPKVLELLATIESGKAIGTSWAVYHLGGDNYPGRPFHHTVTKSATNSSLITLAPLALTDAGRAALAKAEANK